MNTAVMLPVYPKYCENIIMGWKTVEVRKTFPAKLKVPFKCFLYCTKSKERFSVNHNVLSCDDLYRLPNGKIKYGCSFDLIVSYDKYDETNFLNGKVIGEFICDGVTESVADGEGNYDVDEDTLRKSFLTIDEIKRYGQGHKLYFWHISALQVYEKPENIRNYFKPCLIPEAPYCPSCAKGYECAANKEEWKYPTMTEWVCLNTLKHAPQSWCYVEDKAHPTCAAFNPS